MLKAIRRRGFALILAVVLLFTVAFSPRVRAIGPGTIAVVAGVAGALSFSAAWLAYARANGVDLSVYNMLSGQDLVSAITDLVQQYLDDERDGISTDTYFDSIGIPSIVKFSYNVVGNYLSGGIKAIISALGVATVFEPFTNWFVRSKLGDTVDRVSDFGVVRDFAYSRVSVPYNGGRFYLCLNADSDFFASFTGTSVFLNYNAYTLGRSLFENTNSVKSPVSFSSVSFECLGLSSSAGLVKSVGSLGDDLRVRVTAYNRPVYLAATQAGVAILSYSTNNTAVTTAYLQSFSSGGDYFLIPYSDFFASSDSVGDYGFHFSSAVQSEFDGTNRYPSTSVPSGKQLEIPVLIPNVSTDYPVSSDTEEQQSNDIAAAIVAGQIDNDLSVVTSNVEIVDEVVTPTVVPTEIVTPVPTASPSPLPEEYTPDITMFFPFCIPFDTYRLVGVFLGSPRAPSFRWEFTIPIIRDEPFVLEVDLSPYDNVAALLRKLEAIAFVIGLASVTRRYISW